MRKGTPTQFIIYIEYGAVNISVNYIQYPVRESEIVLETLKSGSLYGIYSILSKKKNYFQIEAGDDSLIQILTIKDLELLRVKIKSINVNCLAHKDSNKYDFVTINK